MNPNSISGLSNDFVRLAQVLTATRSQKAALTAGDAAALVLECVQCGAPQFQEDPRRAVIESTCGVISSYMDLGLDASAPVVAILRAVTALAPERDPSELMTWAMEGAARAALSAGSKKPLDDMHEAIDGHLAGAGEVFSRVCREAAAA